MDEPFGILPLLILNIKLSLLGWGMYFKLKAFIVRVDAPQLLHTAKHK